MLRVIAFGLISTLCLIGSICTQYECYRSGSTVRLALFSLTRIRHQVAPWNVGHGAANSLLAMPSSSRVPVESPQKPEPATRFLPLEGLMEQREVTPRVPETIAIRYVSNGGNDADDGMSWGTAKHTIYGALVSLPGGSTKTAGSGTIYVGNASSANPEKNAGIWLMGPNDPNYASPPAGWLKCPVTGGCVVNIIGIGNAAGGPNGHKPRVQLISGGNMDRNHPAIWLSAVSQPIYIANFQMNYSGRVVVIGECSNNDRTGTCGAQNIILDNDAGLVAQLPALGPCTDIASNVFWLWLRDYGCGGNAYRARGGLTADNAAAILIDGSSGSGSGLIYIVDADVGGGGVKVKQGSNGASVYVRNLIEEGDYSHPQPPAVWFTGWSTSVDAVLDNVQCADFGPGSMNCIQNDGVSPGGPTVINSNGVTGAATVINQDNQIASAQTVSPLRQNQTGFFNNYLVGRTDVARRIAGLTPTRFANKAASNSASWTFPQGTSGVTFTQNLSDPFGGTGAAKVAFSSSVQQLVQMGCTTYAPAAGDWIVAGVWARNLAQTGTSFNTGHYGQPHPTFSATFANYGMIVGDGQWQYLWIAEKVASGAPTSVCASVNFTNKLTPTLYGPTLYVIPARTQSDNEVLEFASTMNSVDQSCQAGQICNVAGHPLIGSSYGTLSNCSSLASPAKCDSAPAGSFILEAGSTTATVNTTAVTANSQILIIEDSSLGSKLRVSCNKTTGRTYMIADRAPGNSFTVRSSIAPTKQPACLSFQVLN